MKHYGDITKISGFEVPIVDIVCGGSPCQDLSVAGKQKGLKGERSGLFMEQIRIVKEMREHDKQIKQQNGTNFDIRSISPRYMVWENVPGALSSNEGRDFQTVLTEIIRISKPNADDVPLYGGGDERLGLLQAQYSEYPTESLFPSPTEYMTHSFGEYPKEERESHLWQILTVYPHPKYYLSEKSCQGILNRSVKRGKQLPELLEKVLMKQSAFKNEQVVKGGGKGILIQNDRTGALSTLNNQYVLANTICIEGNGVRKSHHGDGYIESDKMYTLNTTEQHKVAYEIGGGQVKVSNILYQDKINSLCASDTKGVGNQYVQDGKVIIERRENK